MLERFSLKALFGIVLAIGVSGLVAGCGTSGGALDGGALGATGIVSSKVIGRGQSVEIGRFLHWDKNCWADTIPQVKIVKPPKFGSVAVKQGNHKIMTGVCEGIPIKGSRLTYRGRRKGVDSFTYSVSSGPQAGVHTVQLTVQ